MTAIPTFTANLDFSPSPSQLSALKSLYTYIFSSNEKLILLEGQAGTGKTTIISELLKLEEFKSLDIIISAPTNKALDVISSKINIPSITFVTIFSLLGQKIKIKEGNIEFSKSGTSKYVNADLIIIDEASMISESDYTMIKSLKTRKTKQPPIVIFLGDRLQLPPVKEDNSPIFTLDKIVVITLIENMRSLNSSSVSSIVSNVRDSLKVNIYDDNLLTVQLDQSLFYRNKDNFIKCYTDFYTKSDEPPIIICYTNIECTNYNELCRGIIFNKPKEKFVNNECIIFNTMYNYKNAKFNTSEQARISSISDVSLEIPALNMAEIWIDLSQRFFFYASGNDAILQNKKDSIRLLEKFSVTYDGKLRISGYDTDYIFDHLMYKKIILESKKLEINGENVYILDNDEEYKIICEKIKSRISKCFQELQKNYISDFLFSAIIEILFNRIWKFYHDTLVSAFADISYGYAITVYKAQGSTYSNVYIDLENIINCGRVSASTRQKGLYTAVSRASKTLKFYSKDQLIYSIVDKEQLHKCQHCGKVQNSDKFCRVNYKICFKCITEILSKVSVTKVETLFKNCYLDKNKLLRDVTDYKKYDREESYQYYNIKKLIELL